MKNNETWSLQLTIYTLEKIVYRLRFIVGFSMSKDIKFSHIMVI
jgi:hypothetical protein